MSTYQNLDNYIKNSCMSVIKCISSSNLNYCIQDTPYSTYITLRKSLTSKLRNSQNLENQAFQNKQFNFDLDKSDQKLASLERHCETLVRANANLKTEFEGAVIEAESNQDQIRDLQVRNENLIKQLEWERSEIQAGFAKFENEAKNEKKVLEGNLLKISLKNKTLKKDKAELEKENGSLRASLKSSRRDFQRDVHEFEKKNKTLEDLIENLKEFKSAKLAEEKDLRSKGKKVDRKLKLVEEKEAKLKVDLKRK
jgi:chromosome segregation ATPase